MKKKHYKLYGCNAEETERLNSMIEASGVRFITYVESENCFRLPLTWWEALKARIAFAINNIRYKTKYRIVKDRS